MPVKKIGIIFNTGLGDGLMMLPLVKVLKMEKHHVTAIICTDYMTGDVLHPFDLFDKIIVLHPGNWHIFTFAGLHFRSFDFFLMSFSSSSWVWSLAGFVLSKRSITSRHKWYLRLIPGMYFEKIVKKKHVIFQNINLAKSILSPETCTNLVDKSILPLDFGGNNTTLSLKSGNILNLEEPYLVVQISASNNTVQYKNWRLENWISLLQKIVCHYPGLKIYLMGDEAEIVFSQSIVNVGINKVTSLVGQTNLYEAMIILNHTECYIGLDSGLMHFAAITGRPTFTVWGPTSPKDYGYEIFNNKKHRDICLYLKCHPCRSWVDCNNSRVSKPEDCPDLACLMQIYPEYVIEEFIKFYDSL